MRIFNFLTKQNINIITYFGSDILAKAIPFLFIPLMTKHLNPNEYGNISLFNISVEIFVIIIIMGGNTFYKINFYKRDNKIELFYSVLYNISYLFVVFLILSLLLFFTAPNFYLIKILPIIVLMAYMQSVVYLFISYYQCKEDALTVGMVNLCFSLVNSLVMAILVIEYNLREPARYYSYFAALVISILFIGCHFVRKNGMYKYFKINNELLRFGLGIMPYNISWWARSGIDRLLIGWFLSVSVLGVYSLALQILSFLVIFCNALNQAFIPSIMQGLSNKNYTVVKKTIYSITITQSCVCIILGLLVPLVFGLFIDQKYNGAVTYLPYMCAIYSLQGFIILFSNVLYYFKHEKYLSKVTFSTAILHVSVLLLMLHFGFGIMSVVYSSAITFSLAAYLVVRKSLRLML